MIDPEKSSCENHKSSYVLWILFLNFFLPALNLLYTAAVM